MGTNRRDTNTVEDKVRRARTEALFRDVNERIAESAARSDVTETEFVCECSDPTCTHRMDATLDEYERVRGDATTFMVRPGHEQGDIERVVRGGRRFNIVEKVQSTVRATVRALNPRSQPA
jgi:hypothetical protein